MSGIIDATRASVTSAELRRRSQVFAIGIVQFCRSLPTDWVTRVLAGQLLRAGTSVAANYRACGRARSEREFCAKIGIVAEESDESLLWLELLPFATASVPSTELERLTKEADELTAIFTASHATARHNLHQRIEARKCNRARK